MPVKDYKVTYKILADVTIAADSTEEALYRAKGVLHGMGHTTIISIIATDADINDAKSCKDCLARVAELAVAKKP